MLSIAIAILISVLSASPDPVRLSFSAGCVSVAADDASLHALLSDWARIGQVKITGLEELPDRPVTLHKECADERKTLEALLDDVDRLMLPREIQMPGASAFLAVTILSRDASLPRRARASNAIPEIAYPDPMPGRDWSISQPDLDAPPPIVLERVAQGLRVTPLANVSPEATYEYARPVTSGLSELLLPRDTDREQEQLRMLIESIQSGEVPESLFEYAAPVRTPAAPEPDKQH